MYIYIYILIIYIYIYKFQENQRTKTRSLFSLHSPTHFTHSQLTLGSRTSFLANDDQPAAWGFALQGVEVVGEKIWVLGGDGFGTERARLAQGGFRGQFNVRNPFKRNF